MSAQNAVSAQVTALILAAGASRRLGRPKALVKLPTGETLLARAVGIARQAGLPPAVTVAAGDSPVFAEAAAFGARVIEVPDALEGMSASVRAGVAVVAADSAVQGVLVVLVDQWRLRARDLATLVRAWQQDHQRVVAARYAGTLGVPAIFGRSHFAALLELRGDQGARQLIRGGSIPVTGIDVPRAEADLDTARDLSSAGLEGASQPDA